MKIKTITCHDVYNLGASLQAHALAHYLKAQGHDVEIIDYKPYYLRHYELTGVRNPRFDKPLLRQMYQIAKFPGRLIAQLDPRKKAFDRFKKEFLPVTPVTYTSNEELKANPPEADLYIAGSDQIWNPLFPNGKDPAFFLDFVPQGKKKVSYAASFAVDRLEAEERLRMQTWLNRFDAISVREKSGTKLVSQMFINAVQTCDPVFLLDREYWAQYVGKKQRKPYCFVYDFEDDEKLGQIARQIAARKNLWIISAFKNKSADEICRGLGPFEFRIIS